jgi:predicted  nucleic acid-binding Zn-ribbon protein
MNENAKCKCGHMKQRHDFHSWNCPDCGCKRFVMSKDERAEVAWRKFTNGDEDKVVHAIAFQEAFDAGWSAGFLYEADQWTEEDEIAAKIGEGR